MERVRRRPGHGLSADRVLSSLSPVTPEYVRWWARRAHGSPLYRSLAISVADDPDLMRVIRQICHHPPPNILFGAVQYLLMSGAQSPLADHYPSLTADPKPPDGAAVHFKEFVLDHEEQIVEIGRQRYTQTNECKRCVALLPGIWATGLDRFHLVEIGASAGLNLAIDAYRYKWGAVEWGPDSPVILETESRGGRVRPHAIDILTRTGLDLDPVDVTDPEDRDWLVALIWPEHNERRARLERALDLVSEVPVDMIEGDATETLPETLTRLPAGEPVVIMNSMSLMQFEPRQRESLYRSMEEESGQRPLRRVSFELLAAGDEWVTVAADQGRGLAQIGQAHPHGEWIDLYARP